MSETAELTLEQRTKRAMMTLTDALMIALAKDFGRNAYDTGETDAYKVVAIYTVTPEGEKVDRLAATGETWPDAIAELKNKANPQ